MAATYDVDIAALPGFLNRLKQATDGPFTQPLKLCAESARSFTKLNFARGLSPDGTAWAPLRWGRVRGGNKPLRDTGLLMASITARGAAGGIEDVTATTLTFGTNLDRAAIHQYGGTILPKKGKALAIPLTREALAAGSPRRMANLVLLWRKGASKGVLVRGGEGGEAQFALVPRVRIQARPFLGWNADMVEDCSDIVGDWVMRKMESI